ncbi:MAG: glucokinase [Leptolyngbyaceae bacterium]|nr:glucokinase [Leptolyngbyaceae bacterium]
MTQLLAGDIGGTKTILRLAEAGTDSAAPKLLFEQEYPSSNYPDLVPMVQDFFSAAAAEVYGAVAPTKACFGIAGPVNNNTSDLTNLSWLLEGDRLAKDLKIDKVELINDFAAIGYGVLGLTDEDLCPLQDIPPRTGAPIAVIGAGTGLGQCFLTPQDLAHAADQPANAATYKVYASEGGHTDFAPRSELEFHLQKYLLDKYSIDRISVERVVSGQGIAAIYQFLRDRQMGTESPQVGDVIREWERQTGMAEKTVDPAATIAIAAANGDDYLSQRTMQIFAEAYGAEAGNLALKILPYGGLYIAGGIAAKNLELMKSGAFIQAFTHKGRMTNLLENMPVHVVLNPKVGLIGAALYAAQI